MGSRGLNRMMIRRTPKKYSEGSIDVPYYFKKVCIEEKDGRVSYALQKQPSNYAAATTKNKKNNLLLQLPTILKTTDEETNSKVKMSNLNEEKIKKFFTVKEVQSRDGLKWVMLDKVGQDNEEMKIKSEIIKQIEDNSTEDLLKQFRICDYQDETSAKSNKVKNKIIKRPDSQNCGYYHLIKKNYAKEDFTRNNDKVDEFKSFCYKILRNAKDELLTLDQLNKSNLNISISSDNFVKRSSYKKHKGKKNKIYKSKSTNNVLKIKPDSKQLEHPVENQIERLKNLGNLIKNQANFDKLNNIINILEKHQKRLIENTALLDKKKEKLEKNASKNSIILKKFENVQSKLDDNLKELKNVQMKIAKLESNMHNSHKYGERSPSKVNADTKQKLQKFKTDFLKNIKKNPPKSSINTKYDINLAASVLAFQNKEALTKLKMETQKMYEKKFSKKHPNTKYSKLKTQKKRMSSLPPHMKTEDDPKDKISEPKDPKKETLNTSPKKKSTAAKSNNLNKQFDDAVKKTLGEKYLHSNSSLLSKTEPTFKVTLTPKKEPKKETVDTPKKNEKLKNKPTSEEDTRINRIDNQKFLKDPQKKNKVTEASDKSESIIFKALKELTAITKNTFIDMSKTNEILQKEPKLTDKPHKKNSNELKLKTTPNIRKVPTFIKSRIPQNVKKPLDAPTFPKIFEKPNPNSEKTIKIKKNANTYTYSIKVPYINETPKTKNKPALQKPKPVENTSKVTPSTKKVSSSGVFIPKETPKIERDLPKEPEKTDKTLPEQIRSSYIGYYTSRGIPKKEYKNTEEYLEEAVEQKEKKSEPLAYVPDNIYSSSKNTVLDQLSTDLSHIDNILKYVEEENEATEVKENLEDRPNTPKKNIPVKETKKINPQLRKYSSNTTELQKTYSQKNFYNIPHLESKEMKNSEKTVQEKIQMLLNRGENAFPKLHKETQQTNFDKNKEIPFAPNKIKTINKDINGFLYGNSLSTLKQHLSLIAKTKDSTKEISRPILKEKKISKENWSSSDTAKQKFRRVKFVCKKRTYKLPKRFRNSRNYQFFTKRMNRNRYLYKRNSFYKGDSSAKFSSKSLIYSQNIARKLRRVPFHTKRRIGGKERARKIPDWIRKRRDLLVFEKTMCPPSRCPRKSQEKKGSIKKPIAKKFFQNKCKSFSCQVRKPAFKKPKSKKAKFNLKSICGEKKKQKKKDPCAIKKRNRSPGKEKNPCEKKKKKNPCPNKKKNPCAKKKKKNPYAKKKRTNPCLQKKKSKSQKCNLTSSKKCFSTSCDNAKICERNMPIDSKTIRTIEDFPLPEPTNDLVTNNMTQVQPLTSEEIKYFDKEAISNNFLEDVPQIFRKSQNNSDDNELKLTTYQKNNALGTEKNVEYLRIKQKKIENKKDTDILETKKILGNNLNFRSPKNENKVEIKNKYLSYKDLLAKKQIEKPEERESDSDHLSNNSIIKAKILQKIMNNYPEEELQKSYFDRSVFNNVKNSIILRDKESIKKETPKETPKEAIKAQGSYIYRTINIIFNRFHNEAKSIATLSSSSSKQEEKPSPKTTVKSTPEQSKKCSPNMGIIVPKYPYNKRPVPPKNIDVVQLKDDYIIKEKLTEEEKHQQKVKEFKCQYNKAKYKLQKSQKKEIKIYPSKLSPKKICKKPNKKYIKKMNILLKREKVKLSPKTKSSSSTLKRKTTELMKSSIKHDQKRNFATYKEEQKYSCRIPKVEDDGARSCGQYESPKPVNLNLSDCYRKNSCYPNILGTKRTAVKDYHQKICRPIKKIPKSTSEKRGKQCLESKSCYMSMVAGLLSKKTKFGYKKKLEKLQNDSVKAFKKLPLHTCCVKGKPTFLEIRDMMQRLSKKSCGRKF